MHRLFSNSRFAASSTILFSASSVESCLQKIALQLRLLRHDGYVQDQEAPVLHFQGPECRFLPPHRNATCHYSPWSRQTILTRAPPVTAASTFHFQWSTNTIPFRIIFRIVHGSKTFHDQLIPSSSTLEISNITKYYHN